MMKRYTKEEILINNGVVVTEDGNIAYKAVVHESANRECRHIKVIELMVGSREEIDYINDLILSDETLYPHLPLFRHCAVCGKPFKIKSKREDRKIYCENKCKVLAFYIRNVLSHGEFDKNSAETFIFSAKGKTDGDRIEKIGKRTWRVVYRDKKDARCAIVTLTEDKRSGRCYDDFYNILFDECDNESETMRKLDDYLAEFIVTEFIEMYGFPQITQTP